MTEEELDRLNAVGDMFWHELGKLVAKHVSLMPKHLKPETLAFLQDKCSVYGTNYEKYLPK